MSPNLAHLRVWEVGWGNVPLDLCGVPVRESRATCLAGARWGLSPGLSPFGGSTVTLIHSYIKLANRMAWSIAAAVGYTVFECLDERHACPPLLVCIVMTDFVVRIRRGPCRGAQAQPGELRLQIRQGSLSSLQVVSGFGQYLRAPDVGFKC